MGGTPEAAEPARASRPIALVTGATAGIGAEFARQLAASRHDLVLVARTTERLERVAATLTADHGVRVAVLSADLMTVDGLAAVEARVRASDSPVDVLVNNAGFGLLLPFDENTAEAEAGHHDLLVAVPLRLMHAALQQMLPRSSGTIINIASVAGFTPRGSYGAAKAWLISFSRWANIHYRPRGITVTAVAPGFVRTEFHERMDVQTDTIPAVLWLSPERVVRIALRDVARGRAVTVPTVRYKLIVALSRVLPARLVAAGTLTRRPATGA
ncbi:short-subunit dehydrogenase [Marisediminicola sp. UYEF4]|uniref:SDR family NAD(P)-dependent oxidoreductase n=1 Tax=Marisediminicola sp. UYEF4 TaxID=1756384 RepID=UPI0033987B67